MKQKEGILLILSLLLIAGAAAVLLHMRTHQRLGNPGVRTQAIPGSHRLEVELPERVLDYTSERLEPDKVAVEVLPKDTSFGRRHYKSSDGFEVDMNAVLMGTDRTSIHKPQICLSGLGWKIQEGLSSEASVPIDRPFPYTLPVMKLVASNTFEESGQARPLTGIFVYWFVADKEYTAHHEKRMWSMAMNMLLDGVLQRWAYISCFAVCHPGQEEATFERMKKFIVDAVPQFQLVPSAADAPRMAQGPATP